MEFPNSVSERTRDIISRILTLNPKKRIKIDDIKSHPYYRMGERLLDFKKTKKHDKEKIKELTNIKLIEYGYDIEEIKKSIDQDKFNNKTTTYYLIYNKYKGEMRKKYESECQLEMFNTELEITLKKELENNNRRMKVPLRNKNHDIDVKKTRSGGYISDDIFSKETNEKESKSNFFKTEDNMNHLISYTQESPFFFKNREYYLHNLDFLRTLESLIMTK